MRIERWPDRLFTACTPLREAQPTPALHWIDGPTAEQIRSELDHRGLPSPLEGCRAFTLHRSLSATAIAASVLLHQQFNAEPHRDTAIAHHGMQQGKLSSVRKIARREAPTRSRLEHAQQRLLERPLPIPGEFTMTRRDGITITLDGEHLWARAEVLRSLFESRPGPDIGHTPGHSGSRRVSLALASLLADIDPARLDLLVTTPRS